MKTGHLFIALSIIIVMVLGCITRTAIHSRLNPEYSSQQYRHILVVADFADLGLQEACESKVNNSLQGHGVKCTMAHQMFFGGSTYSDDAYRMMLDEAGVEAVLIIFPMGAGFSQTYVPPRTRTETSGSVEPDHAGGYRFRVDSETRTRGGYDVYKPWGDYEIEMYDAKRGDLIWYATVNSSGNAFSNFKTLVKAAGGKTVNKLADDGLIP